MTIKLKSIAIDSASWPQLPPKTQPQKILYSEARGDGYEQSDALRSFGAPRQRASPAAKSAVKSGAGKKYRFLKLGLVVCAILLAGLAFAEPNQVGGNILTIDQIKLKESEMKETTNLPSAAFPGSTLVKAVALTPLSAETTHPKSGAVQNLKAPSDAAPAAEPEMAGTYEAAAAAAAAATAVALGVGLVVTRRRRSIPIPDKTTQEVEHTPSDPPAKHEPEPAITTPPPVSGLAYVDPAALLGSMKRAFPKLRITEAAGVFALTSLTGHNFENQDYALAFDFSSPTLGPVQITFVADGCGGHFGGRDAAYTAVSACVEHLLKSSERNLIDVARSCLEAASQHVASVGTQMWGTNEFRCTLIVLLANQTEYALAHIGDGGMDVRRANGSWERLLTPQREEKTGYLTGSLGPCSYGHAAIKTLPRMPGDWLVAGTDGIYVDEVTNLEEFWTWPRQALSNGGQTDLGQVLNTYVAKCIKDLPTIFDDNVTALVLTTPKVAISAPVIVKTQGMAGFYQNIAAMNS